MTRSPRWREFETGDNIFLRLLRFLIVGGGLVFLILVGVLELTWPQQAVLGLLLVLIAIWIDRSSTSYLVTLTLMLLSCFSTFRYGFWRVSTIVKFFADPGSNWTLECPIFCAVGRVSVAQLFLTSSSRRRVCGEVGSA